MYVRKFSPNELEKIMNGKIITWTNNRLIEIFAEQPDDEPLPNSLYFLFDGYDDEDSLLKKLKQYNVSGIVVRKHHNLNIEKWKNAKIGVIEVSHLTDSYIELCKVYRSQFNIPFIEVIGSSGKTTTKEMIGAILNEKISTLVGYKNYNAPSGIAYNIFNIRDEHQAAVLEVGMKAEGIISYCSDIVKPNIGVITSIHRSHFVSMGSIENIISAKSEILNYLPEDGILIINGEDENCSKVPLYKFKGEVLRFGFLSKFDIWASDIEYKNFKTYFKAHIKELEIDCVINTVGKYNVANALAAILVGLKLGLNPEEIVEGLSRFEPLNGRLKIYKGIKNTTLIDDNFNANPDSTKLLIQEVPKFTKDSTLIFILGDMENPDDKIREYARKVHFMIGEELSRIEAYRIIAIGKWALEYVNGAMSKGVPQSKIVYFKNVESAGKYLLKILIPNSIILFKASVYTQLKDLIKLLRVE